MLHGHAIGTSGGIQSGIFGYTVNAANLVAAVFVATGQDIACVHESGSAIFALDADGDGVRATMILPSLVAGTVGGGTALPAQRDALEAMGCAGPGRIEKLAEIVRGFALALDLSTLAAIVGGQFADAHERLGRNRPVRWLTADDLAPALLQPMFDEPVARVEPLDVEMGTSILSSRPRAASEARSSSVPSRCACTAPSGRSTSSSRPSRSTARRSSRRTRWPRCAAASWRASTRAGAS